MRAGPGAATSAGDGPLALVCADNVRIVPGEIGAAIEGIGYMEGASHMGNVLILGQHVDEAYVDAVRELVDASGLARAGVTSGARHGSPWVMVRALASSTDALSALVRKSDGLFCCDPAVSWV